MYCGPRRPRTNEGPDRNGKRSGNKDDDDEPQPKRPKKDKDKEKDDNDKKKPVYIWELNRAKGIRHLLTDCPECPQEEKNRILQSRAAKEAITGPTRYIRAQTVGELKTTGRLARQVDMNN